MLLGLVILLLVCLNLGGVASVVMGLGRGEWLGAAGSALFAVGLNIVGFRLLRDLRERG